MKPKYTQKQLKDAAKNSFFNPKAPGPLSIIANMDNPDYGEMRAIEFISEAREILKTCVISSGKQIDSLEEYQRLMSNAIGLLLLAKVQRGT